MEPDGNARRTSLARLAAVVALLGAVHSPALGAAAPEIGSAVERAVLAEDWAVVAALLGPADSLSSPVARLVKGHAYLATNRNNESLCLFLSASGESDLRQWEEWTSDFARRNQRIVIARYFRGDALARRWQWDGALAELGEALKIHPNHALVLNARGVVHARRNDLSKAKDDFTAAGRSSGGALADPYANLGERWIQQKEGARGALRAFSKALDISPEFALARHGRGWTRVVLREDTSKAHDDLKAAFDTAECLAGLFMENQLRYAAHVSGSDPDQELAALATPGTTLRRQFDRDTLIRGAANDLKTSQHLRGMTWLPFNQRAADFFGNRAAEKVTRLHESYGDQATRQFASRVTNPDYARGEFGRVEKWNAGGAKNWTNAADFAGKITTGAGVSRADPFVTGAGVGLWGLGQVGDRSRERFMQALPKVNEALGHIRRPSDFSSLSVGGPGGVQLGIPLEDGNWPFREYYGLGYGLTATEQISLPAGEGRPADDPR